VNIFFLDSHPYTAATMMCDKHVRKMIIESAQMLSTAHHVLDGDDAIPNLYKPTHRNHPCSVWVRENNHNYRWLYQHFIGLSNEFTYRWGAVHLTYTKLAGELIHQPKNIAYTSTNSSPPQCMPDEFKQYDLFQAYRAYYRGAKSHLLSYTLREWPKFLEDLKL